MSESSCRRCGGSSCSSADFISPDLLLRVLPLLFSFSWVSHLHNLYGHWAVEHYPLSCSALGYNGQERSCILLRNWVEVNVICCVSGVCVYVCVAYDIFVRAHKWEHKNPNLYIQWSFHLPVMGTHDWMCQPCVHQGSNDHPYYLHVFPTHSVHTYTHNYYHCCVQKCMLGLCCRCK